MDVLRRLMDKTGTAPARAPALAPNLLSRQVADGRYFFLDLAPAKRSPFALTLGGRERCRPDYAVRRDSFAYDGLEYVAEGTGAVVVGGRRHELRPGTLFSYSATMPLQIETSTAHPLVKYFACFAGSGVAARLRRAALPCGSVRQAAAHGEVRAAFEELIREGQWQNPLTREVCTALGELLLLRVEAVVRARAAGDPARETFARCRTLIEANAERLVSLEEIASAARLDVSTICRLFRRFQGTSPYQYLLRRKMNLAAEHLIETGATVKDAAARVGFADPYHFSRVFKSVHGVPPSALLRHRG